MSSTASPPKKKSKRGRNRGKAKGERPSAEAMWLTHIPAQELPPPDLERYERHIQNANVGRCSPFWFNVAALPGMVKCQRCAVTVPRVYAFPIYIAPKRGTIGPCNCLWTCEDCIQFGVARRRARFAWAEKTSNTRWGRFAAWLDESKKVPERLADLLVAYVECFTKAEWDSLPYVLAEIERISGEQLTGMRPHFADFLLTEIRYDLESYFMMLAGAEMTCPAEERSSWFTAMERLDNEDGRLIESVRMLPESDSALQREIAFYEKTGKVRRGVQ